MEKDILKPVRWVGTSYNDWKAFPEEVQDVMGYALYLAQQGKKAGIAKPLKGYPGTSVHELVDNFDSNTWRAIYTVQFKGVIYVLHAFQKKSKRGIATPRADLELIKHRLQLARDHYETHKV